MTPNARSQPDREGLLDRAQLLLDQAQKAKQAGNQALFWRLRRRGLLLQARWYAGQKRGAHA